MAAWRAPDSAPLRVVVLGTGQMGTAAARLVLDKPGLELVGLVARRADRAGRDAGEVLGLPQPLGWAVSADLDAVLAATRADAVIQTTCSRVVEAEPEIGTCLTRHANVVSIAEELSWPWASSPERAEALDLRARAKGVSVLGTGVNPGFVLDLLVITLTGVCSDVTSITATRVNDLSPYGPTVLRTQGVGLSPAAFAAGVADGTVVGHMGFPESIGMIAAALGWQIDRVEQAREPIVATVRRETPFVVVDPGMVAGCRHSAVGYDADGTPLITLVHPQQVCPEVEGITTGDTIEIAGTPPVRVTSTPEIPGGIATAALAVNMVPRVVAAPPGLVTMADLPAPAALPSRHDQRERVGRA